jgi:uncharacterized protein (TIGR03382 family)
MWYLRDLATDQLAYTQNTDPFVAGTWSSVINIGPAGGSNNKRNAMDCAVGSDGSLFVAYHGSNSEDVLVARSTDGGTTWQTATAIGYDSGMTSGYWTFDLEILGTTPVILFANYSPGGDYLGRSAFEAANNSTGDPVHLFLVTLKNFSDESSFLYQDVGLLSALTGESLSSFNMDMNLEFDQYGLPMFLVAVDRDGGGSPWEEGNLYFFMSTPEPATAMLLALPALGLLRRRRRTEDRSLAWSLK